MNKSGLGTRGILLAVDLDRGFASLDADPPLALPDVTSGVGCYVRATGPSAETNEKGASFVR
jgi:hypothetical protein